MRRRRVGRRALLSRVVVVGESMAPTLLPGDRLLVLRTSSLLDGDVVAVEDPEQPDRVLVKRLAGRDGDALVLSGDNAAASRDSREFGPVPPAAVTGRAVYRYHPPERAGRIRRGGQAARGAREGA